MNKHQLESEKRIKIIKQMNTTLEDESILESSRHLSFKKEA